MNDLKYVLKQVSWTLVSSLSLVLIVLNAGYTQADSPMAPHPVNTDLTETAPSSYMSNYPLPMLMHCSHDEAILAALTQMAEGPAATALREVVSKPIRIVFKDLKMFNKNFKDYDALSWISMNGEQVIFLNERHRNAPPEALAALIAHESMHDDAYNSLNEEAQSWLYETRVWQAMIERNAALSSITPGAFPLVDRENRILGVYKRGTLDAFVRQNPGYKGLPETSPGFESMTASTDGPHPDTH